MGNPAEDLKAFNELEAGIEEKDEAPREEEPLNVVEVGNPKSTVPERQQPPFPKAVPNGVGASKKPRHYPRRPLILDKKLSSPNGQPWAELRFTHEVLDSNLSHAAKLLLPAIALQPRGTISYDTLLGIIPCGRDTLAQAINEAEAGGWVRVARSKKRNGEMVTTHLHFALEEKANPNLKENYFISLPLTKELRQHRASTHWIVRAIFQREQSLRGGIQLPLLLAARFAGVSHRVVEQCRVNWLKTGALKEVGKHRPAVFTLTESAYEDKSKEIDTRYRSRRVNSGNTSIEVWATEHQAEVIQAKINKTTDAKEKILALPWSIITAPEAFSIFS